MTNKKDNKYVIIFSDGISDYKNIHATDSLQSLRKAQKIINDGFLLIGIYNIEIPEQEKQEHKTFIKRILNIFNRGKNDNN